MQPDIEIVSSFSSYTKGLHTVSQIAVSDESVLLTLLLPEQYHAKLLKRFLKFPCKLVSIDGVAAQVTVINTSNIPECFEVVAKVAQDRFSTSTLAELKPNDKASLGMMSKNPQKWLLDSFPIGKVQLVSSTIAAGHDHTKEITFECSESLFERIKALTYIGLNGSGLFLREPRSLEGRYYFSVHIGRQTREITLFGNNLSEGTAFTLTLPFKSC